MERKCIKRQGRQAGRAEPVPLSRSDLQMSARSLGPRRARLDPSRASCFPHRPFTGSLHLPRLIINTAEAKSTFAEVRCLLISID
ncbi:hypothetical protein TcasGA2_TC034257 [Tribolium castaneum]|uniref:Uncharacterized protein n=1 Tax=Tribolium castaneum TaxID=7070 RepID=A0A139WCE7_TRICA|nr:hypothetical protein TcasGA2_TC034257 [Tribolium castaneum]